MTAITISTEIVTEQLLAEVASLYAAEHYKTLLWSWQFAPRFGQEVQCIVARDYTKVIGFNATMPIQLIDNLGEINNAIWSCDFIVAKDYRGKGIGSAIKDEMRNRFTVPIVSLGISDSAFPLLLKKNWQSPVRLDVWDMVLKPQTFKQIFLYAWTKACRLFFSLHNQKLRKNYTAQELPGLPQDSVINKLWDLHRISSRCVEVFRCYDYLHWRYEKIPFRPYKYLSIGAVGADVRALIIFRETKGNHIEVVDFIGEFNEGVISSACAFWLTHYSSAIAIHWNNSVRALSQGLIANGFVKKSYGSRFATLSSMADQDWALVAGDSDGDFLRVAKEFSETPTSSTLHPRHT